MTAEQVQVPRQWTLRLIVYAKGPECIVASAIGIEGRPEFHSLHQAQQLLELKIMAPAGPGGEAPGAARLPGGCWGGIGTGAVGALHWLRLTAVANAAAWGRVSWSAPSTWAMVGNM